MIYIKQDDVFVEAMSFIINNISNKKLSKTFLLVVVHIKRLYKLYEYLRAPNLDFIMR